MSARFLLFGVLSINFMLAVAAESGGWIARAASRPGDVPGVTRDPGGLLVVPKAQIILRSGQGGPERSVVSGADGAFFVADLEPGCCEATAWKQGFASSSITLKVTAGQTTEVDLPLGQSTDLQKPPIRTAFFAGFCAPTRGWERLTPSRRSTVVWLIRGRTEETIITRV
jgi:Carboxypeptidase regulatory-like domain